MKSWLSSFSMSDRYGTFDGTVAGFRPRILRKEKWLSMLFVLELLGEAFEGAASGVREGSNRVSEELDIPFGSIGAIDLDTPDWVELEVELALLCTGAEESVYLKLQAQSLGLSPASVPL